MKKLFTLISLVVLCAMSASAQLQPGETRTVAGNKAILKGSTDWAPADAANDMTYDAANDCYVLVVENCGLEVGEVYEWKITKDHAWNIDDYPGAGNYELTVPETAMYTVTFILEDTGLGNEANATAVKTGTYTPDPSQTKWTIAGSPASLFGSSWSPEDTNNDMEYQADGTYKKTYKAVTLGKGTVEFKVAKDHGWGTAYPSSNYQLAIPEDGIYDLTIIFNPDTKAITVDLKKTGSASLDHTWTVAGGPDGADGGLDDPLFGKTWDPSLTANDMSQTGGTSWTLNKKNIALPANTTYGYKVCADHDWATSYGAPEDPSQNATFTTEQAGTYDIIFRFNSETTVVSAEVKFIAATGITVQSVATELQPSAAIYDLQGRRLNGTPQRGLYIQNGKKFAVK